MEPDAMNRLRNLLVAAALLAAVILGGLWWAGDRIDRRFEGSVETVSAATLKSLQEQNRLSAFAARFVAVVTSEQSRLGLSAKKTLIMPGLVRYEVDLSKLRQQDVRYDKATGTLSIALPPLDVTEPQVDLRAIQEYDSGGILLALTDAETTLDKANRAAATAELAKQARGETPMQLARDATARAIEHSFAMPLRAAGLQANVTVSWRPAA